ncbi:efflux RND transporter periplasmic adaptor subunit, partial [bacterium]|nr:efflux RND transporter periplasmic adaptor subunit [bacterium]
LDEISAPPRNEDIKLSIAQVKQAQAALDYISNQIQNSIIKSPIDGTLTKFEYEIGEQTLATKYVAAVLGDSKLEIEIDISEADITKINIGDKVEITLDALDDELKFYGTVFSIEPAETIIQNVIYYKTKINFNSEKIIEEKIKPGMTANVIITTSEKNNVLIIPSRAIIEKNGEGKFVRILIENKIQEIPIETGLYGDGGLVEIISGLNDGQEVVTYINKKK